MKILIRSEAIVDAQAIEEVILTAFRNAPHTEHTEQYIVKALREAGVLTVSLVAELNGRIVGHVAVSPVSITGGATRWYGLGPVSVIPELQGKGIGSRLMRAALRKLKHQDAAGCVLLGDPVYYRRFGFKPEIGLVLPGVPPEYFQALSYGGPIPHGEVSYHAAFSASD